MNSSTPTGLLDTIRERRRSPRQRQPGDAPGALVFEGSQRVDELTIEAVDYGIESFDREMVETFADCQRFLGTENPTWLHVTGLHEVSKISEAGELFQIPDLFVEDVLNTGGRPKIEVVEDSVFIQIKILEKDARTGKLELQQLSMFLGGQTLVTFCEAPTGIFDPIFRRLGNKKGRLRTQGLDYLLWALLDTVVDHAISALNLLEQNLIEVDELIQNDHAAVSASDLYAQKHEVMLIQHLVRPNREIIHSLRVSPSNLISDELSPYLDDLRDHAMVLSDECDALRDYAASIREYLLVEQNQRMNNVMKVLTCISTIFLPLTFLAGVYGMNFDHMPELGQPWAYPLLWVIFLAVGGSLVFLFRKKRWL